MSKLAEVSGGWGTLLHDPTIPNLHACNPETKLMERHLKILNYLKNHPKGRSGLSWPRSFLFEFTWTSILYSKWEVPTFLTYEKATKTIFLACLWPVLCKHRKEKASFLLELHILYIPVVVEVVVVVFRWLETRFPDLKDLALAPK